MRARLACAPPALVRNMDDPWAKKSGGLEASPRRALFGARALICRFPRSSARLFSVSSRRRQRSAAIFFSFFLTRLPFFSWSGFSGVGRSGRAECGFRSFDADIDCRRLLSFDDARAASRDAEVCPLGIFWPDDCSCRVIVSGGAAVPTAAAALRSHCFYLSLLGRHCCRASPRVRRAVL